eukprot:5998750-Alexandrium_andersonii.AAC.1
MAAKTRSKAAQTHRRRGQKKKTPKNARREKPQRAARKETRNRAKTLSKSVARQERSGLMSEGRRPPLI